MSAFTAMDIIPVILQIVVLIPVIRQSGKWMEDENNGLLPVFFTFAMEAFLLCNVYYVIHGILRPGSRLPFAADEIAECALIFMLAAGMETIRKEKKLNISALVFSVVFTGLNMALWIIWSGEWMQDIIFGLPYIYILYLLICGISDTGCFESKERKMSAVVLIVIELLWLLSTRFSGSFLTAFSWVIYVFMYLYEGWLFGKCFAKGKGEKGEKLYPPLAFFLWAILISFSSDGIFYAVSQIIIVLALPLMLHALKKELYPDDLC
ncbi:MAG: hypothetical protein K6E84_10415 [Lachnospiraceae bacterium]|nr:hypothetical protein [Lachnospiraceae bacterium]